MIYPNWFYLWVSCPARFLHLWKKNTAMGFLLWSTGLLSDLNNLSRVTHTMASHMSFRYILSFECWWSVPWKICWHRCGRLPIPAVHSLVISLIILCLIKLSHLQGKKALFIDCFHSCLVYEYGWGCVGHW